MAVEDTVRIKFVANTAAFNAGLKTASSSLSRFGTNAFFLGSRITAGIGVPIALLTKAVVGIGAAFDQAMTESLAIMGRDGQQMRGQMEDIAKSIALQTKFSAEEAAQAYFFLASSGLNAAESMQALPVAAKFAQAGVIGLEKATELLSDAYITLGLRSADPIENMQNMQRVADVLTEANNRAQGSIIEFAQALTNRAGVAFRTFNIDVEEGVAALAAFAERGIKGRTAGRQLFIVIRDLQRAVLKNNDAWEKLIGKDAVFSAAEGDFKNLADIIGTLENRLEGMSDKTKKTTLQLLGFQERSLQATLALIGASDRIRELEGYLRSAGGVTQRVAEKQMMSFTNQLGLVSERLKQVGIDLFDAFRTTIERDVLPFARALIDKLKGLVLWIKLLHPETKASILAFMALGVALGPVVAVVGALSLVLIPLIAAFKLGIAPIIAWGMALKGVQGSLTALARTWAIVRAGMTGATFVGLSATAGVAATALAVLTAKALAWIAIIYGIYKALSYAQKAVVDYTSANNTMASSIGVSTLRLTQLVNEYQTLAAIIHKSDDQKNRFAHTTEMLSAAIGRSADSFRNEEEAGRSLLGLVRDLTIAEFAAGKAAIDQHIERKAALEEEARLIGEQIENMSALLALGEGAQVTRQEAGVQKSTSFLPGGIPGVVTVDDSLREKWLDQLAELSVQLENVKIKTKETEEAEYSLRVALGLLTQSQRDEIQATSDAIKAKQELDAQLRISELQAEAYYKRVDAIAASLKGLATEGVAELGAGWAKLTVEEQANTESIKRLWEQYSKLRPLLAPGEMPADLEALTSGLRLQAEATKFAASATGKLIDSMKGIDSVFEHYVDNQQHIIDAFNEMQGEMDPRFFEAHGATILKLAKFYGDRLVPEMDGVIDAAKEWKKTSTNTTDSVVKDQEKAFDSIVEASNRMTASMMDKQAELNAFTLSAQDAEIVGLKKGYNIMKFNHAKAYADMVEDVALLPEAERFAGIMRLNQLEADSTKMLALEERIGLLRILKALGVDDKILRNHEDYSKEWLEIEIDRMRDAVDEWEEYHKRVAALTALAGLFNELSRIVPGLKEVGEALDSVASATTAWGNSIEQMSGPKATAIDKITGAIGMATAAMSAFISISQVGSRAARGALGAMTGAQMGSGIGAMFGPAGAAIGAAVGALVGGIAGLLMKDPGWKKIESTIKDKWGISVSETLSKEIAATAKEIGSDLGASLLHINQVIEESGGVTAGNVGKWTRHVRDAFSMIHQGIFTTSQAAEVLDENFASLVKVGTQVGGVLRADVFELMRLDEQFRTNSQAVKEFKESMVTLVHEGLMLFAEGVTFTRKKWEEAFDAKIAKVTELGKKTEEEIIQMRTNFDEKLFQKLKGDFRELSQMVEMSFAVMVKEGKSLVEIILALGPALDELEILVKSLGFTGSETIEFLLKLREFTKVNEGLMKKIAGTTMMLVGMANSGYMTEKAFNQMGRSANRQFNQLIKNGLSADEALLIMMPTLMALSEAAELYGFAISKGTQKIIDQAKAKGLWGKKAITVDDKQLAAQLAIADALGVLIELFGGELPKSLVKLQKSSKKESDKIRKNFKENTLRIQDDFNNLYIDIEISDIDIPDIPKLEIDFDLDIESFHRQFNEIDWSNLNIGTNISVSGIEGNQHGGLITKPTLSMIGEGGETELIGPIGFMSKALEGALSQTGPSEAEREMLAELHGLRSDLKTLPIHLRDALILAG